MDDQVNETAEIETAEPEMAETEVVEVVEARPTVGNLIAHPDDVEGADMDALLSTYNYYAKKKVKEFRDRPTAEKRTRGMLNKAIEKPETMPVPLTAEELEAKQEEIRQKRSAGTARSWENPEVKAKRTQRNGVEVDGVYYPSVYKAYETLGLDPKNHIKHRIELKERTLLDPDYVDEEYGMQWRVVAYRPVEKPKKVKEEGAEAEAETEVQVEAEVAIG